MFFIILFKQLNNNAEGFGYFNVSTVGLGLSLPVSIFITVFNAKSAPFERRSWDISFLIRNLRIFSLTVFAILF